MHSNLSVAQLEREAKRVKGRIRHEREKLKGITKEIALRLKAQGIDYQTQPRRRGDTHGHK